MKFTAKLLRDGKLLLDEVTVDLSGDNVQPPAPWKGSFAVPPDHQIDATLHELELADGRSGRIQVRSFYLSGGQGLVFFDGLGQLAKVAEGEDPSRS